jgi:hypothetical protein
MSTRDIIKYKLSPSGIFIIRHGARTSNKISRKSDSNISTYRKGLTIYGFTQSFLKGQNFFKENLNRSKNKLI